MVAHAGLKESYHGRSSGRVRSFALYGDTTGETDEYGLPVRYPWAQEYRGRAMVAYGHTPVPTAEWVNNTICLDTGVVFGGSLTALRYPEREIVSVPAERQWYAGPPARTASHHGRGPRAVRPAGHRRHRHPPTHATHARNLQGHDEPAPDTLPLSAPPPAARSTGRRPPCRPPPPRRGTRAPPARAREGRVARGH